MSRKVCILILAVLSSFFACQKGTDVPEMTVPIRMMDIQDIYFREKMKEFERQNQVRIDVVTFDQVEDVRQMMELERSSGQQRIGLVKTALEMVYPLAESGYLIPLDEIVDSVRMERDLDEYLPQARDMGNIDGRYYYIPRKLETYLLFYLESKVKDALDGWEKLRPEMDAAFREFNGYGLPAGYELEREPADWDFYDIAVLSFFWANQPYQDILLPRVAHRGKRYAGTVNELATRVFQLGGDKGDILAMNTGSVKDMFQWESFFVRGDMYHPGMWERAWSGGDIWKAVSSGEVFLCYLHQIDLFFVHGGSDPTMSGYLSDPSDMRVSVLPKGVSLELTGEGLPEREGGQSSNLYGWWWGIPITSPDPDLSYRLARFITSRENQIEECSRFGMFPVRKDVLDDLAQSFDERWKREIFEISRQQFDVGTKELPRLKQWPRVGKNYLDAWYDVSVTRRIVESRKLSHALEAYARINQDILSSPKAEE